MARYGLLCLLMASLVWGGSASAQQAEPSRPPVGTNAAPAPENGAKDSPAVAAVPPDAPVITIPGLCDHPSGEPAPPNCTTVVTRVEFEKAMDLLHPGSHKPALKFFADKYANYLITAYRAQEMGLDKMPDFDAKMEVDRMALGRRVLEEKFATEEKSKVTDKEIESYYQNHVDDFVEVDVDRIFVPKLPRAQDSDPKLSEAEQQKRRQAWFEDLRKEADKLRVRALAGEDFLKLQVEACLYAGLTEKDADPSMITLRGVRRSMFSEGQRPVMDVKVGEISSVLTDNNGYSIFRVKTKTTRPFEKASGEIRRTLRTEHSKQDMDALLRSATVTYSDDYFGPVKEKKSDTTASNPGAPQSNP
ncbi:MAG TPA: peptidylprolyl isomerase [Terriglobales bacterium]|nr:peptidylprolyl isomerase [Terriglobales bacterium]